MRAPMTTTMTPGRCHRAVIVCFILGRDETPDANEMFRLTTLVFISIKKCLFVPFFVIFQSIETFFVAPFFECTAQVSHCTYVF